MRQDHMIGKRYKPEEEEDGLLPDGAVRALQRWTVINIINQMIERTVITGVRLLMALSMPESPWVDVHSPAGHRQQQLLLTGTVAIVAKHSSSARSPFGGHWCTLIDSHSESRDGYGCNPGKQLSVVV